MSVTSPQSVHSSLRDYAATPPAVAISGGGQLARMMAEAASACGIEVRALVESASGSAAQSIPGSVVGQASDVAAMREALGDARVLTFEHEHQDPAVLAALAADGVSVQPSAQALLYAQDKLALRQAVERLRAESEEAAQILDQPLWCEVSGDAAAMRAGIRDFAARSDVGWPLVLKTPRGGYDGHGVLLVREPQDLESGAASEWIESIARGQAAGDGGSLGGAVVSSLLVEQAVPFTRELAALVARRPSGQMVTWPVVETRQVEGMCADVIAPAPGLSAAAHEQATAIARLIADGLGVTGVLAVELFACEDPAGQGTRLLINELAMRPHNSGHWTQDGCLTSQFEQHLRAVADLPLGSTQLRAPVTVMVNVIGAADCEPGSRPSHADYAAAMEAAPEARIHMYGKEARAGRKLGHVTISGSGDPEEFIARAATVARALGGR